MPTVAAYVKKIGAAVAPPWVARARISPKNATGSGNLYSRNFAWSSALVGLPGRSGLNMGFGVSYNSLVWTRVYTDAGDVMVFDADQSNVTPGFRFGFATIEPSYPDYRTGRFTYLMVAPSGARVDFRQIGASEYYETGDSTYTQLKVKGNNDPNVPTPPEDLVLTVTTTDGTQTQYIWRAGAYRAAKIKDRNGNFITINHDEYGLLRTVTDTLGRTVTVNYDNEFYPTSVTQIWKNNNGAGSDVTHTWATFSYTTKQLQHNFGNLPISGPPAGITIKVLDKVTAADGSSTRFDYNSYGQVWRVNSHAADNHKLNHVAVNLETVSGAQTNCPRFTETRSWAENFNQNQETVVTNSYQENQTLDGVSGLTLITVAAPDGITPAGKIYSKSWMNAGNWSEAIPFHTKTCTSEACTGGDLKQWSSSVWTQDDTSLLYPLNPRQTESIISDAGNTKKTTVSYHPQFGLVNEIREYDAGGANVLRKTATDYELGAAYTARRITGLVKERRLYEGESVLMAKTTFAYDEGDFSDSSLAQTIAPIRHDTANYGASFVIGRGNLTSTTRWDVTGETASVTTTAKYNTAGNVVAQIAPLNRTTKIGYQDFFNDGVDRNAFAYPTKLTDAAGNFSEVKYRFDTGANVWAKSPAPSGNATGKISEKIFDATGRIERERIVNTGAYTRYEYPTNGIQSKIYSTVVDINGNGVGDAADEILAESWADGAGRARMTRTELPNSAGGWSGGLTEYDVLGRVKRQTVPTEINASWNPAGDDATRGWLWTEVEYDWKSRVTKETNTDGTFKTMSYEGCGCAGGEAVTMQGEEIIETNWQGQNPNPLGRRKQRIEADILGRAVKTIVYNWNGTTPYSTVVNTYNARDQVTVSKHYAGAEGAATFQETTATYDGHGRLKTRHRPEQRDAQNNLKQTAFDYFADGQIKTVTDGRGAATNYAYNDARGLLTNINYSVPAGSNIQVPGASAFGYDAAGNRRWMTDAMGRVDYKYDELSRLTEEIRQFSDSLPDAPAPANLPEPPISNNAFRLRYDYTLTGQLKMTSDPYNQQFDYAHDRAGRLLSVTGTTAFGGVTNYAYGAEYRAWGALKHLNYGNGVEMNIAEFNDKLQAKNFEVKKAATGIIKKQYQYYGDGSLKIVKDELNNVFDRLYKYDFAGRTVEAKAGKAARGEASTAPHKLDQPYSMQYQHNQFGQITQINGLYYSAEHNNNHTFSNNRNPSWDHDAEGNVIQDADASYEYDAAGRLIKTHDWESNSGSADFLDGEGGLVKRSKATSDPPRSQVNYYIRSSLLDKVVSETDGTGKKLKTFVPANGTTLAEQSQYVINGTTTETVLFVHQDASGASLQQTTAATGATSAAQLGEYDALGRNVADASPFITLNTNPPAPEPGASGIGRTSEGYHPGQNSYCLDGLPVPKDYFLQLINAARISGAFGFSKNKIKQKCVFSRGLARRTGRQASPRLN